MRARWIAAAVAAGLLVLPAGALAGGWATVELSSTPAGLGPGDPWLVEMKILQHGRTPLDGVQPSIVLTEQATGETRTVAAEPTGRPGVYSARAVFPEPGRWTYAVDDGFTQVHDYPAVTIGDATASQTAGSAGGDGFPWGAVIVAILAGAAAALLMTGVRRRRGRAALGGQA
jgi:YtkA-like